jgi:ribonuclease HI
MSNRFAQFRELTTLLSLPELDVIIIADGSGTTADKPGGYTAVIWDRRINEVYELGGSLTHATNNVVELASFPHALWLVNRTEELRQGSKLGCNSDSELTVKCGQGVYSRNSLGHLWASVEYFERKGVVFEWKWVPRNSNPLNAWCDKRSREMRILMEPQVVSTQT